MLKTNLLDAIPYVVKNLIYEFDSVWKTHDVPPVLQNKYPPLTDTVGFGPILLFPPRHQLSPLTSRAIWEQTQPSNSTEFCHRDVGRATQKKAAGRHK